MRLIAEPGTDHEMIGVGSLDRRDAQFEISVGDDGNKGIAIRRKCRAGGIGEIGLGLKRVVQAAGRHSEERRFDMSDRAKFLPRSRRRAPDRIELRNFPIAFLQPRNGSDAAGAVRRQVQKQRQKLVSPSPVGRPVQLVVDKGAEQSRFVASSCAMMVRAFADVRRKSGIKDIWKDLVAPV